MVMAFQPLPRGFTVDTNDDGTEGQLRIGHFQRTS